MLLLHGGNYNKYYTFHIISLTFFKGFFACANVEQKITDTQLDFDIICQTKQEDMGAIVNHKTL